MLTWILLAALVLAAGAIAILWRSRMRSRNAIHQLIRSLDKRGQRLEPADIGSLPEEFRQLATTVGQVKDRSGNLREEARSAAGLFRTVVQELVDGLILVDDKITVTFYNRRAEDLFPRHLFTSGAPLIEVCGSPEMVEIVRQALRDGLPVSGRIELDGSRVPNTQGQVRHYVVETAPLGKSVGGGAWVLIRDITERVHTDQIRKDFVANASHELRTPLSLITGYIETLQGGLAEDPEGRARALDIMGKHAGRLARIIDDMLTISKLEGGPEIADEPFDFGDCAASVMDTFIGPLEENGGRLLAMPEPGRCPMHGDRFFWDQILINLIENAIKENPDGVGIGISWKAEKDDPGNPGCTIEVWDDGVGIPRAHIPFIFNRFYRVATHHSQNKIKGTGLGLSIVRRAVEAHGGKISVESEAGERTRFVIRIPG